MEFFGEEELVTIVPSQTVGTPDGRLICIGVSIMLTCCQMLSGGMQHDTYAAVQGEWGPFKPSFPTQVPLWLALALQKKRACQIQIPEWMLVEKLEGGCYVILWQVDSRLSS